MIAAAAHLTRETHAIFDDPRRWGSPGIWEPPTFDLASFQSKVDRIAGVTPSGKSIVKLRWAWQCRTLHNIDWDEFGKPIKAEWRQRYRFMTVHLPDGSDVDIAPPRFIAEEYYPPSLLRAGWEAARSFYDPVRDRTLDRLGELPADGYYRYLFTVAEHDEDEACCARAWKTSRRRCWGYYRLPEERDLLALQGAVFRRNADRQKRAPDEPLTVEEIRQLDNEAYAADMRSKVGAAQTLGENFRSWGLAHGWKGFTDSPKALHWGKYQTAFPSTVFKETHSGLVVPKGDS